ncbi:MAG: phytoene desaturase [Elusimicrobia bacterium]|nr:phytoene desaturase [Elusimicrobiota bacterium]
MRVIVIGAGIGGLACGARLAAQGYDVAILEKNHSVGGRCARHETHGFTFDTGPTLCMMPDTLEQFFHAVGRPMSQYLSLQRLDPAYRITFSDGRTLDFTQQLKTLEQEIQKFGVNELAAFYRFLGHTEALYRTSRELFIDRALERPADYLGIRSLPYLLKARPWRSVAQEARRFFRSPHLQIAFSFQTLYLGISPLDCPSIYSMLPYIDLVQGVHYPVGGMSRVAEALARVFQELGGRLHCQTEVEEIVNQGGQVRGVLLHNEEFLPADIVVSNVDLPTTYHRLLKGQPLPWRSRRPLRMKKGCSAVVFLWGVSQTYPRLHHHNLYLPVPYTQTLRTVFEEGRVPEEPAFYLCAPSKTDPSMAPPGCESIMVLVPVPNQATLHDWPQHVPVLRQRLLHLLQQTLLPGLAHHIVTEQILTPPWYAAQYALADASTFGLSPSFFQSAMFRPQRRSPDLRGLYFVGASAHPGNGVPIVLISARLAADAVVADYGTQPHVHHPVANTAHLA